MVLKEQGESQVLQESGEKVPILTIKCLNILCKKGLLFAWLFQVVEYELVKTIDCQQRTAFNFKLLIANAGDEDFVDYFQNEIKVEP